MSIHFIVLAVLLSAIIYMTVLRKTKRLLIFTAAVFIIFAGTVLVYFVNTPFRDNVNMLINRENAHRYIINDKAYYLPLPTMTALKYRTSDNSAVYITKSDLNKIIAFYKDIADKDTFDKSVNNNDTVLLFEHNDNGFCISVKTDGKSNLLFVEHTALDGFQRSQPL